MIFCHTFIIYILIIFLETLLSNLKFDFALIQEIIVIYILFYPLILSGSDLTGRLHEETRNQIGSYFLNSYLIFTVVIMVTVIVGIIATVIENKKKQKEEDKLKKLEEEEENKKKENPVLRQLRLNPAIRQYCQAVSRVRIKFRGLARVLCRRF